MNEQSVNPAKSALDDIAGALSGASPPIIATAFIAAAYQINSVAASKGEQLQSLRAITVSASTVLESVLRTQPLSEDIEALKWLARLNIKLAEYLDSIVLYSEPDDPALQALCKLAEARDTWPMMVRPGDQNFTKLKLGKLNVGSKVPADSPASKGKRTRSLATDANRLTLKLVRLLEKHAVAVLKINRNGVPDRSTPEEARQTLLVIGVPEPTHRKFIEILRRVERYPYSAKTVTQWGNLLTDYILLVDPKLEKYPELRAVRNWQCSDELHAVTRWKGSRKVKIASPFRRQLQKFFQKPLQLKPGPTRGS